MAVLLHLAFVAPASAQDLFLDRAILPADAADLQRRVGRPSISSAVANETVGPTCLADMIPGQQFHGDTGVDPTVPAEWYDAAKVARGYEVFNTRSGPIGLSWMLSLVVGLCYDNFLEVLIFTNTSNTVAKDIVRYGDTALYLTKWCTGDPMNQSSPAYQSVQDVRTYHDAVRTRITPVLPPIEKEWMTQYDMGIVQTAFMSMFAPTQTFGFTFTDEEQDDFMYLWRVIGRQLGIDDHFNVATLGQTAVHTIIDDVFSQIILPGLANPPAAYNEMAGAFVGMMNLACLGTPCFTVPSVVGIAIVGYGQPMPSTLSYLDKKRVNFFITLIRAAFKVPMVEPLISSFVTSLISSVEPPALPEITGNPLLHAASACPSLARKMPDLLTAHRQACTELPAGHAEPEWCRTSSPQADLEAHLERGLPVGTKLLLMAPAATALTMITAATAVLAFGARSLFA